MFRYRTCPEISMTSESKQIRQSLKTRSFCPLFAYESLSAFNIDASHASDLQVTNGSHKQCQSVKQFKSNSKCCDHKARFLQRANNLSGFMPKVGRLLCEAPTMKRWPREMSGRNNVPFVPSPAAWLQNMCGKRLRAYLHGFQRAIVSGASVMRSRTPQKRR